MSGPRRRRIGSAGFVPENRGGSSAPGAHLAAMHDGAHFTRIIAADNATLYAAEEWPAEQPDLTPEELAAIADEIAFHAAERSA